VLVLPILTALKGGVLDPTANKTLHYSQGKAAPLSTQSTY
jgi:hypothetical protein